MVKGHTRADSTTTMATITTNCQSGASAERREVPAIPLPSSHLPRRPTYVTLSPRYHGGGECEPFTDFRQQFASSSAVSMPRSTQFAAAIIAYLGANRVSRVQIYQADKRFSCAPSGSSLHHYSGQRESSVVYMTSSSSSSSAAAA